MIKVRPNVGGPLLSIQSVTMTKVIRMKAIPSTRRNISARTRSAASMSGYEQNSPNLRSERRNAFIQMSGPLRSNGNNEFVFKPPRVQKTTTHATPEPRFGNYPSSIIRDGDDNNWAMDDFLGKNSYLMRSRQLGMCNDPYCTTCPTSFDVDKDHYTHSRTPEIFDEKFHNLHAKGWAANIIPGVMNPHAKAVQQWNKFFVICCGFALFLDPFFLFLLSVKQDNKCIVLNGDMTTTIVVLRSMTDFIFLLYTLFQSRLAYVTGEGNLVEDPKRIARHYLFGYFIIDFFVVLPLPQIILGVSGANYAKNLLLAAVAIQNMLRLLRFLPLLAADSPPDFICEVAWACFGSTILTCAFVSHMTGSIWYSLGLQRVNQCFIDACRNSNIANCKKFIDCGGGDDFKSFEAAADNSSWVLWKNNKNAAACFEQGGFHFGIFQNTVNLTTRGSLITRYVYSLFWGFQQLCTLAGNQVPSYYEWEVIFTMAIMVMGLGILVSLIGNAQKFLLAPGQRRLEMSLRRRDVETWMRRLPQELRSNVRAAQRFNWSTTRGVNEEMLMENLPEDLQRDIRRHLFQFIRNVRIFQGLHEPILNAICDRLKTKTYIRGSKILYRSSLIDKMVIIIRGKMESIGEDRIVVPLGEGDVCGEELLTWCFEHSYINKDGKKIRIPGHRLLSNRLVRCSTHVEAFVLRAADVEEVTSLFSRFFRSPRVQGAIRYESPYWRGLAARRIQVVWRYRKKKIGRVDTSSTQVHDRSFTN